VQLIANYDGFVNEYFASNFWVNRRFVAYASQCLTSSCARPGLSVGGSTSSLLQVTSVIDLMPGR